MSKLAYKVLLANFSCTATSELCTKQANMGWRYVYFTSGGLILLMSLFRITIVRFHETPQFLLCQGMDDRLVKLLRDLAQKYRRPFALTIENLRDCGEVSTHAKSKHSLSDISTNYKGLFATRDLKLSTSLLWLSWALIGLAYPLFYIFLPDYLAASGAQFATPSVYTTWRDYAITNACGIPGPIIAGFMSKTRLLGRKYTMVIGGFVTRKPEEHNHLLPTSPLIISCRKSPSCSPTLLQGQASRT